MLVMYLATFQLTFASRGPFVTAES